MLIGILLAAGRAGRMGKTKQLLPWPPPDGASTIVASAYDALAQHASPMIVVLGHDADEVADALQPRVYVPVRSDPDAPMYESVRAGLRRAMDHNTSADILLHPADHPGIAPDTVARLVEASNEYPGRAIIPQHAGKGGHPVLIPANLVPRLIEHDGEGGLRQYWIDRHEHCVRIDVADPGSTRDIDTPQDYDAAK